MYFNLFNCPLNKSVCLSIDASATVSPASCLFITKSWQFMLVWDDEDVGVERIVDEGKFSDIR